MKTLTVKNRKLLFNLILGFLIVALPLFVWAVSKLNFNPNKKAGGVTTTPLIIEEQFTGSGQIDSSKWNYSGTIGTEATLDNDRLRVSVPSGQDLVRGSDIVVQALNNYEIPSITGNFDASVDLLGFDSNINSGWQGLTLGSNVFSVRRHKSNNQEALEVWIGDSIVNSFDLPENSQSVRVRIERSLQTINIYYDLGDGYVILHSFTDILDSNNQITLPRILTENDSPDYPSFSAFFDNYSANATMVAPTVQHPMTWITEGGRIQADDFYIESNGKTYNGQESDVTIQAGYISDNEQYIEAVSNKYGDELRLKINFKKDVSSWWINSVDVYNSNYANRWISYTVWTLNSPLGQEYSFGENYDFNLIDPYTNGTVARVHFNNLRVQGFPGSSTSNNCANPIFVQTSPQYQNGRLGETLRYNVSIENSNSTSCGNYSSHLIVDKPSNWNAVFGQTDLTIAGGQTIDTYIDITSPTENYILGNQSLPIRLSTERYGILGYASITYNLQTLMSEADLAITDIALERVSPPQSSCEAYQYKVTIKNNGTERALKTRLQTYIDPPQPQTHDGCNQVMEYGGSNSPVPALESQTYLEPGESYIYSDYFNPSDAGEVTIRAVADIGTILTEHNEQNNYLSKNFNVIKLYPTPELKEGDVNGDNRVNLVDIGILIDEFDSTNPTNPRADINGDGRVGLIDIGIIIDRYEW